MTRSLVALCALPLVACSNVLDINDVTIRDAGTDATDAPPQAPPNTVIGRSFTRHQTPAGVMDVPTDLSQAIVQALIVDPAQPSGYRTVTGAGKADGTFTIAEVPDGAAFLFKLGTTYFATMQHVLERRFEIPIRGVPAPAAMTSPTSVSFNVVGMSPFVNGPESTFSRIEVDSFNVGYTGTVGGLANNARALTAVHDWGAGVNVAGGTQTLPEAANADDLTVLHLRSDVIAGTQGRRQRVTRVIDTFTSNGITVANGATTPVNGSWSPATANRSISLSITRGAYDTGYDATNQFAGMAVFLDAHPVRVDALDAATVFGADLFDWSRSGSLNETLGFMYADPYPPSWPRALGVAYTRLRYLKLPGTTQTLSLVASNFQLAAYTGGAPVTTPVLQPPANVKVATKDAAGGGLVTFDGTAPIAVTWTAVPAAKLYIVRVDRVFQNGSQTRRASVATLITTEPAIKIPAEVFGGGEFFAFTVEANRTPADYSAGELMPSGLPQASASTVSGMFRLSDRCGNGTTDTNELCDTSGESASCDIDCTPVQCGDGLRNTIVEACDTVRDTSGCDSDCTLPVCGDNRINTIVEDCDDGMPGDQGNGCSAACKFNNVCGDGTVQALAELCDPGAGGQTAACDSDCTPAQCGDGHLNPLNNEECDDGNSNNADGCTTQCKLN